MAESNPATADTGAKTGSEKPLINDAAPASGAGGSDDKLLALPYPALTIADLSNIQGDIIHGLPKKAQKFFFFTIVEVESFRKRLISVVPLITTCLQTYANRQTIRNRPKKEDVLLMGCVNISFSWRGLQKVSHPWNIGY